MKVDFNQLFKDLKGNDLAGEKMSDMIARALYMGIGVPEDAESKYLAYRLGIRLVAEPGGMELSEREAELIRGVAAKALTPGAYGQVVDLIAGGD